MKREIYTYEYPRPSVTADCVIFRRDAEGLSVLLIERANDPFKGCWAFPGGFMEIDESSEACAKRELKEETGLEVDDMKLVGAFTEVDRDPRGRTISLAYYAILEKAGTEVKGTDDAAQARWFPLDSVPELAFDHDTILRMALDKIRNDENC